MSNKIKISSAGGKYITKENNDIVIKSKIYDKNQSVTYSTQGELIIDGKCLTYENKPDPMLFFNECKGLPNQKWMFVDGKLNVAETRKCLDTDLNEEKIIVSECDNEERSDAQTWDTENESISNSSDYSLDNYRGKTVVLVESDNPWYINKNTTHQKHIIINKQPIDNKVVNSDANDKNIKASNELLNVLNQANFSSEMIYDKMRPDLGLGHSYASRQGISCAKIEGFGSPVQTTQTTFIIFIFTIIVILLMYRYFSN